MEGLMVASLVVVDGRDSHCLGDLAKVSKAVALALGQRVHQVRFRWCGSAVPLRLQLKALPL
eukprot:6178639-Ditylum_brightwellii.AAC.1